MGVVGDQGAENISVKSQKAGGGDTKAGPQSAGEEEEEGRECEGRSALTRRASTRLTAGPSTS